MERLSESYSPVVSSSISSQPVRRLKKALIGVLDVLDSRLVGALAFFLFSKLLPKGWIDAYSRRVLDCAQPVDPIKTMGVGPTIELVVVANEKDFDFLPLSIYAARQRVRNPIDRVRVIVPTADISAAKKLGLDAEVLAEENCLPELLLRAVDEHHPPGRRGWILQQVLGLWAILESPYAGVLLLDADTVLLRSRLFLTRGGVQLLSLSHEYEAAYERHATKQWGKRLRNHGLSYVTHHQMVQPDVLRQMFPGAVALERWIRSASIETRSPVSEYHSYGRWLSDHYPERVRFGRWRNKALNPSQLELKDLPTSLENLDERFPHSLSVSLHSYLKAK